MFSTAAVAVYESNKVLRNAFLLLALSLIPTIFGVFVGLSAGVPTFMVTYPWVALIGFVALGWALIGAIRLTSENALGLVFFLLFTFLVGALTSSGIDVTLKLQHGPMIIAEAIGMTAAICLGCGLYALTTKTDFSPLGGVLYGSLLALVLSGLFFMVVPVPGLVLAWSFVSALLFSVFLVYDVQRAVNGGETNYVIAALQIYLDVVNIFMNVLQLLGYASKD